MTMCLLVERIQTDHTISVHDNLKVINSIAYRFDFRFATATNRFQLQRLSGF